MAAGASKADEPIQRPPQGYGTLVGGAGAGLLGGRKQRLAIARTVLGNAPIIGLDTILDEKVVEALARLTEGKTTMMVSH